MSTLNVKDALARLNELLPLKHRQDLLAPPLRELHRRVLRSFVAHGRPLSRSQIEDLTGTQDTDAALKRLASDDLVVLTPDRKEITGAYPFTTEQRTHRVMVNGVVVHAMCALDALSVGPMFDTDAHVQSACHVSGSAISIHMRGTRVDSASPAHPSVGIRWQSTSGCAAQSLCLDMIFLADRTIAETWKDKDAINRSVFDLADAIQFGAAFFCPLIDSDQEQRETTPAVFS